MINRAEVIANLEGSVESPEVSTEERSEETKVPPVETPLDSTKEVVKQTESQTEAPSTSEEKPVESEERIAISDEDINKTYEEKKSNIQKRIDRLTAEKKSVQEEAWNYKAELEKMKRELDELKNSDPKKKDYSMDQLKQALDVAIEDGDKNLAKEIWQEIEKREAKIEEEVKNKQQKEIDAFRQKENEVWASYVETFPYENDPDLDIKNKDSLLVRYTYKLYQERPQHYDKFGHSRLIIALSDARDLILQSRISKINNKQTETLEKKLAREKMKNEFGSGNSGVGDVDQVPSKSSDPFEEMFSERMAITQRARLHQTS